MEAADTADEGQMRVREVHLDGIAAMRIMKHCEDGLPTGSAGSLLGIDIDGILEVTYSYPFPAPRANSVNAAAAAEEGEDEVVEEVDSTEYQIEMMKMLRDVNMDNNCVGWYQSTFMETIHTSDVVNYQYTYQCSDELSDNSVVIVYDPIQTKKGNLVLKAFRLSEDFIEMRNNKLNAFIKPSSVLEELPVRIKNSGHVSAFLKCMEDSHKVELDADFEPLSMASGETYMEKHMELMATWIEDLIQEQQKFQMHSKAVAKPRQEHIRWLTKRLQDNEERREAGEDLLPTSLEHSGLRPLPDAPPRIDPLLMIGQLERYCDQVAVDTQASVQKLFLTAQLHTSLSSE